MDEQKHQVENEEVMCEEEHSMTVQHTPNCAAGCPQHNINQMKSKQRCIGMSMYWSHLAQHRHPGECARLPLHHDRCHSSIE